MKVTLNFSGGTARRATEYAMAPWGHKLISGAGLNQGTHWIHMLVYRVELTVLEERRPRELQG